MRVLALVVVATACNGNKATPEDKRAPAPAPVALTDAAVAVDASSGPCFALPFGLDAEQAGIRRLAVRPVVPKPRKTQLPGVTKLVVGKPVRVRGLAPPTDGSPLLVPDIGADALVTMARVTPAGVDLIAPAHLSSAVVRVEGKTRALVAVGDEGLVSLIRYRDEYVPARKAAGKQANLLVTSIEPLAIFYADLASEPSNALVSISEVTRGPEQILELGVLWYDGRQTKVGFEMVRRSALPLYVVPPTLSGGTAMLVGVDGSRFTVGAMTLTAREFMRPGAGACLQTSTTEPATWAGDVTLPE